MCCFRRAMMFTSRFSCVFFAVVLSPGCKDLKTEDAVASNDAFVNEINGAADDVVEGSSMFYKGDDEQVNKVRANMTEQLDRRLDMIQKVPFRCGCG